MLSSFTRARKGLYVSLGAIGIFGLIMLASLAACCVHGMTAVGSAGEKKDSLKSQIDVRGPVAVHEAAHALASVVLLPDRRLSNVFVAAQRAPDDKYLGAVNYTDSSCGGLAQAECLRRRAIVMMAGEASEQVMRGSSPPGEYDDKFNAEEMLRERCRIEGACAPCPKEKLVGGKVCPLDVQIEIEREAAYAAATELVQDHCEAIQLFANRILEEPLVNDRHTISGPDAEAFLKDAIARSTLGACRPAAAAPRPDAGIDASAPLMPPMSSPLFH